MSSHCCKSGVEQRKSSGVVKALAPRRLRYSSIPLSFYLGFFFVNFRVVGFLVPFFVGFLVTFGGFLVGAGFAAFFLSLSFSGAFADCSFAVAAFFLPSAAAPLAAGAGSGGFTGSGSGFVGRLGKLSL